MIAFVIYLVFAQSDELRLELPAIEDNARKFFQAKVEHKERESAHAYTLCITVRSSSAVEFTVRSRKATRDDHYAAREAEARGQAGGMGALAERCPMVWQVEFPDDAPVDAALVACATLASVALGPVLPPDHSTLFGVRGALDRAKG